MGSRIADEEIFEHMLKEAETRISAKAFIAAVIRHIIIACKRSMAKRCFYKRKDPLYWPNDEIADLRAQCNRARRLYQRSRRSSAYFGSQEECKERPVKKVTIVSK